MLFIFGIIFSSESMFITFLLFLYSFLGVIVGFPLVDSQFPSMRLTILLVGNLHSSYPMVLFMIKLIIY